MKDKDLSIEYLAKEQIEAEVNKIHAGKTVEDFPFDVEIYLYSTFGYRILSSSNFEKGCRIDTALVACKKLLRIDESIFLNQPERARFSIAHEVGHLVLHKKLILKMVEALKTAKKTDDYAAIINFLPPNKYSSAEWQADYFGGALLAPKRILEPKLNMLIKERKGRYHQQATLDEEDRDIIYHDLAKIFDVTKPAIIIRIKAAGLEYLLYS